MSEQPILTIEYLCFSYPDQKAVLKGISFQSDRGERTALVGPNGSGKTTLFLLLCGILKPEAGEIVSDGRPVLHGRFNPEVSYLFQSPDDQLFCSTVFDDVASGPLNMDLSNEEVRRRTQDALDTVGCRALAERAPHHLSGGEKLMVAIATILSMMPQIILFDEPTTNLDNRNRRKVIQIIQSVEHTMIIASHDLEFLLETCERVLLIASP
jgi:cobalt/nickel transport system ATP-binding protein